MEIRFIDSICGSGKSTAMINEINGNYMTEQYIYCTPYLSEAQRIADGAIRAGFMQPSDLTQTKSRDLYELVSNDRNISISHQLLRNLDPSQFKKFSKYHLILDEVLDIITTYNMCQKDLKLYLDKKYIAVDEDTGLMSMTKKGTETGVFDFSKSIELKRLMKFKRLYLYNSKTIILDIDINLFKSFGKVTIMSYLVEGSFLYQLLNKSSEFEVKKLQIDNNYKIINYSENLAKTRRNKYFNLINIHTNENIKKDFNCKVYEVSDKLTYTAQTKFKTKDKDKIGKIVRNFFIGIGKSSVECLYSNFGKQMNVKSYKTSFLSYNARATNEYDKVSVLAYVIDKNNNPKVKNYTKNKYEVLVDEDKLALDSLIQWVFRSRLRKMETIDLFLPSLKMRKLLIDWGTA